MGIAFNVISEKKEWDSFLKLFKPENQDIYFTYEYHNFHEANGEGQAHTAIFIGNNGMKLLYPFLLTPIKKNKEYVNYYDIQSAYGYGGPIVEDYNTKDLFDFENYFCEWCVKKQVIAEFIRFHPILNNHELFKKNICVEFNRSTVYVDLNNGIKLIWDEQLKSENRTRIRKAISSGVEIKESNDFHDFRVLYNETMSRLNADTYYYFSEDYFNKILSLDAQNVTLLNAHIDNKIVASAIFLSQPPYSHYHLGCSNFEYAKFAPNNLLMYTAIEKFTEKGFKLLHFGGGTSGKEDDNLLRYKSTFSRSRASFYIGKRVHNKAAYSRLIELWMDFNKKQPKLFLQYNK